MKIRILSLAFIFLSIIKLYGQIKNNSNCIGITLEKDTICSGSKILLLNFSYFACRPCMLEIPYFNYLHNKYKEKVDIVTVLPHVSEDIRIYQQNRDTTSVYCIIRRLHGYEKINYDIIPECDVKKDTSKSRIGVECNNIRYKYGVEIYPTTLLIDTKGEIIERYIGFDIQKADSLIQKTENDIISLF